MSSSRTLLDGSIGTLDGSGGPLDGSGGQLDGSVGPKQALGDPRMAQGAQDGSKGSLNHPFPRQMHNLRRSMYVCGLPKIIPLYFALFDL